MLNHSYPSKLTVRDCFGKPQTFPVEVLTMIDTVGVNPDNPETYRNTKITERYSFKPITGEAIIGNEEEVRRHLEGLVGKTVQ